MLAEDRRRRPRTARGAERDRHTESVSGKRESTAVRPRSRAAKYPNVHVFIYRIHCYINNATKAQKCHVRDLQLYEMSQFPLLNQDNSTALTSNFNETVIHTWIYCRWVRLGLKKNDTFSYVLIRYASDCLTQQGDFLRSDSKCRLDLDDAVIPPLFSWHPSRIVTLNSENVEKFIKLDSETYPYFGEHIGQYDAVVQKTAFCCYGL